MAQAERIPDAIWGEEIPAIPRRGTQVHPEIYAISAEERRLRLDFQRRDRRRVRQHQRGLAIGILVGAVLFAIVMLLVSNHSRLVSMSYENGQIERRIALANIEIRQKEVELMERTDLEAIQRRALELGYRKPRASQIIRVHVPGQDRLVLSERPLLIEQARANEAAAPAPQTP